WPVHWALFGPVDFATGTAFFFLWTPLALALYVRGGGELRHGEAGSAFCLSGFVTFSALFSGGLISPALPWLLIVPIEAAISGRRAAVLAASGLGASGFLLAAFLTLTGTLPASRLDPAFWG